MGLSPPPSGPLGPVLIMPNGTVSAYIDRGAAEVRIFAEPEPDPDDWKMALAWVGEVGDGEPPDEYCEGETVVFVFRVRNEESVLVPEHDGHRSTSQDDPPRRGGRHLQAAVARATAGALGSVLAALPAG